MATGGSRHGTSEDAVAAARAGDESAFAELVDRHRPELQVHCYRLLGSFEEAEDMVQETFLRAWRKLDSFEGRSSFRTWLYRIATNACLDALERQPQRTPAPRASVAADTADVTWLQPYPDHRLDEIVARDAEPDAALVAKETIELAFLVAIQHLPPRQRAVLILRDVLGWSAKQIAELLDSSVASANSALGRARSTLRRHLPARRSEWSAGSDPTQQERSLLRRYMEAHERADATALAALLRDDVRLAMPPLPERYAGREAVVAFHAQVYEAYRWRAVLTRANRQPAVALYTRQPGDTEYRAAVIDVLRVQDGLVAQIDSFVLPGLFAAFGLPPTLP
jgi:RNA polymerase sigma-70 factor, ECF subfamily